MPPIQTVCDPVKADRLDVRIQQQHLDARAGRRVIGHRALQVIVGVPEKLHHSNSTTERYLSAPSGAIVTTVLPG